MFASCIFLQGKFLEDAESLFYLSSSDSSAAGSRRDQVRLSPLSPCFNIKHEALLNQSSSMKAALKKQALLFAGQQQLDVPSAVVAGPKNILIWEHCACCDLFAFEFLIHNDHAKKALSSI